jgi:hypothetical protein
MPGGFRLKSWPQWQTRPVGGDEVASGVERGWASLPLEHRRWLLLNALAFTAALNLIINTAIAWSSAVGVTSVPPWSVPVIGGPSVFGGLLSILVVLPIVTSVLCTISIRAFQSKGLRLLQPDEVPLRVRPLIIGPIRRGLGLSIVSVVAFGPLVILVGVFGIDHHFSRFSYVWSQAVAGVLLGALITPLVAMAAMAEQRRVAPVP